MIPQYLKIKGLYSYKSLQEIDFFNLTDASLFGIFGSVGSGKSSILEAIVFALYGDTERLNKSGDERYYNMTNLSSNELLIDFTCLAGKDDNKYRFVVQGRRNSKNFKDVKVERKVYQWVNEAWAPISIEEVTEKVIGLSYENFRRTVIIPQGNFQEFIELKGRDRSEMMKVLFGLERFDLADKNKRLYDRNQHDLQRIEGQLLSLGEDTPESIATKEQELQLKRELSKGIEAEMLLQRNEEKQQDELFKLFTNLSATTRKQELLKEKENWYKMREEKLKLYEKCVLNFKSLFDQKITKEREYNRERLEISASQTLLADKQLRFQTIVTELDKVKPFYEKREEYIEKAKELNVLKSLKTLEKEQTKLQERIANGKELLKGKEELIQNLLNDKGLLEQNLEKRKTEVKEQKTEQKLDEELVHLRVQKSLQKFADALKDNEPCPLCGSMHHPEILSSNEDFDARINLVAQQKESLKTEVEKAEAQIKALGIQIEKEKVEKTDKFEKGLIKLAEQLAGVEAQQSVFSGQLKLLLWADFKDQSIEEIETQQIKAESEYKRIVESFNRLDAEHRSVEGLIKTTEGVLKTLLSNLDNQAKALQTIQQSITVQLKNDGFETEAEVLEILKQNLMIEKERLEIQTFQTDLQATEQTMGQLLKDTQGRKYDAEKHTQTKEAIKISEARFTALKKEEGSLEKEIQNAIENLKKRQILTTEKKRLEIRKDNLETLQKLFKGNGFVEFVSSIYLKDIANAANERFHRMTRHQLHLEVNADNDFEVRDLLNSGKTRLLKTLSGGQKFQAALSLALALADSIHSRVQSRHNFFFLDEGFGSLDKDSLQIVFETLKSLRKENRIVGIISHVEELQQEIQTFLRIENTEDGSKVSKSW